MIADALKFLAQIGATAAGAANKAVPLEFPGDPHNRYLVSADGTMTKLDRVVPDRNHTLQRLVDVPRLAKRLALGGVGPEGDFPAGSIWINGDVRSGSAAVHLVCRDTWPENSPRADRAVCPLLITPEFACLAGEDGNGPAAVSQQTFRKMLLVQLAGCNVPQRLIDWVAKITWNNNLRKTGAVGNGRESLGLDIESNAMSDAGEAPETVVLRVRVFADPSLSVKSDITCLFEPDPKTQTLALIPLGGEIERAWDEALQIAESELTRLLPSEFPIYRGCP